MNILGIYAFGRNPAACLMQDGKIIAFAEEERFIRLKSAQGFFPGRAVSYCLKEAKLSLENIDIIAFGWDCTQYTKNFPAFLTASWWKHGRVNLGDRPFLAMHELLNWQPQYVKDRVRNGLREHGHFGKIPPIEFVSHHLSHAASAYYASGFDSAAVLVMDGSGEQHTTSIYSAQGLQLKLVRQWQIPDSLGWYYAAMTGFLGFKPYEEDGFLMGLAPYGKPSSELQECMAEVVNVERQNYTINPAFTLLGKHNHHPYFSDRLVELLGPPRSPHEPISDRHKDIAFAAQQQLEQVGLMLAKQALELTGEKKLCIAGGVGLNVKLNGRIAELSEVEHIFVQPVSHDAGSALGAAMVIAEQSGDDPRFAQLHTSYGPEFTNKQIEAALIEARLSYQLCEEISTTAAKAIAAGKIVCWFQGRMEAGPRALGNRSILADASRVGMNDYVNDHVKHRDPWRPFCPSLIADAKGEYFKQIGAEAQFMIVGYPVLKNKQGKIPAVTHIDGTARPQVVKTNSNPKYYRLIKHLGSLTGEPVVLNTSLNVKGEPMACTPEDALRCFYSSGADALAIGDFWIEK